MAPLPGLELIYEKRVVRGTPVDLAKALWLTRSRLSPRITKEIQGKACKFLLASLHNAAAFPATIN